jgi:hypothetical protein
VGRARWLAALVILDCSPGGTASLSLTARPNAIDDRGQLTTLIATAVDARGEPGTGAVRFTSVGGSLSQPETITLVGGTAETPFSCDRAKDLRCKEKVRVVAEWNHLRAEYGAETRVMVGSPPPTVAVEWDGTGGTAPCFVRDAGAAYCLADGGCGRGFTCVTDTNDQKVCVLNGIGGEAQVTLRFGDPLDLDLHVLEPKIDGGSCEIFYGDPGPNNDCRSIGALDLDSNAGCRIDSVDTENVIYPRRYAAPRGRSNDWSHCMLPRPVPFMVEIRAAGETRYWCDTFGAADDGRDIVVTSFVLRNP